MSGEILRTLYLEDDPIDADLVQKQLERAGDRELSFVVVDNKEHYIDALKNFKFDLILSDYSLPGFDGFLALEMQKKYQPHVPFIIVSGAIGDEAAVRIIQAGASDYVLKDKLERLPFAIQRSLEHARHAAQRKSWEKLFHVIENMPYAGFFRTDVEGKCTYMNEYLKKMIGGKKENVSGLLWEANLYQEDKEKSLEKWSSAIKDRFDYKDEFRISSNTGEKNSGVVWISVQAVPEVNEAGELLGYVGVVFNISHLKETEEKLEQLVNYDSLTHLVSRHMFQLLLGETIKRAKRFNYQIALLFCDLDHFKEINDTYGHHVGDEVLKQVAKKLKSQCREIDVISRFGGDEFVILLEKIENTDVVKNISDRIITAFNEAISVDNQPGMLLGTSIGIAVYPDAGETPEVLLKNADQALYRAKEAGKNTYQFHSGSVKPG